MVKKTTSIETKSENKQAVLRYILNHGTATRQELYIGLGLSFPTIKQCIEFLESRRLIAPTEKIRNTGGRSALSYSICDTGLYAIGVFISPNHITAVCVNLSGAVIEMKRFREPLNLQSEAYLQLIGTTVREVQEAAGADDSSVIGVGLSVPSLVSEDGETIRYGMTTDFTGITRNVLSRYIPYPTEMFHDSESAAVAEIWRASDFQNVIYLNLNNVVGSCIILDGRIYRGSHALAGEIGHVIVDQNSKKKCYCGQYGCFDTVCSAAVLEACAGGSLEDFFQLLSQHDETASAVWDTYLGHLSLMIQNQKMMFDCSFIIGGYVGNHIGPYMDELCRKIDAASVFTPCARDYVFPCRYRQEATAAGAAIQVIDHFIQTL